MIARDAEPIGHSTPYPRVDIRYIGRKRVIGLKDWMESGDPREPDPAAYRFDSLWMAWVLKDV